MKAPARTGQVTMECRLTAASSFLSPFSLVSCLTTVSCLPSPVPFIRLRSPPVPIEVKMAKLSPTMESGQLVKWLVKPGDKVKEGDTLAEIQTDKAVMPLEAFDEGTVAHLDVAEGAEIALGQRILVLAKKGEDPQAIAKASGSSTAPSPAKAKKGTEDPAPEPKAVATSNGQESTATPSTPEQEEVHETDEGHVGAV